MIKQILAGAAVGGVVVGAVILTGETVASRAIDTPIVAEADAPTVEPGDHWTEPTVTPAPEYTPPAPSLSWEDEVFLDVLDAENIYYVSPEAAINAGHAVCDGLYAGLSGETVGQAVMEGGGYSPYDAGYIVGASWSVYCPEAPL